MSDSFRQRLARAFEIHRAGRLGEARAAYAELLAIEPSDPEANNLMGLLLIHAREPVRAVRHIRRALRADPDNAQSHFNLGIAFKDQQRMPEAAAAFAEALRLEPDNREYRASLGNALRLAGQRRQAVDILEDGLRRASGSASIKSNLALAQNDLGTECVQRRDLIQGMRHFLRAIELEPRHAQAQLNMGLCLEQLGRLDEAERHYQAAIQAQPDFADAHFQLAHLRSHRASEAEIEAMQRLANSPGSSEGDRVKLFHALGFALESAGRHAQAFAAMARAHAIQARHRPFSLERCAAQFEHIQRVFSEERLQAGAQGGSADDRPVLIVGMPRSGTSLAEQVLASHPGVHGQGESMALSRAVRRVSGGQPYPAGLDSLSEGLINEAAAAYLEELQHGAEGAKRITDTTPMNFLLVGFAALMLPRARFVFCLRDPMDNGLSLFRQLLTGANEFSHSLEDLGAYYRLHTGLLAHWRDGLPGRVFDLHYEHLVQDTEAQVRRLLDFCGLPFDERCLAFHQTERAVRSPSAAQVRQPVYDSSIGAWKHYAAELEPLRKALATG